MTVYLFPGQGSQNKGMGEGLFEEFPDLCKQADEILGYSVRELCLADPNGRLAQTEFTQPALFVVNALTHLRRVRQGSSPPDFLAGHSLGEYNALLAAGVFDFEVGLKLVRRRGELMSKAPAGGMAAIVNCDVALIEQLLQRNGLSTIDVANLNSPKQTVLSGPVADLQRAQPVFEQAQAMFIPLNVSAAFHSRYMRPVVVEFEKFLKAFPYNAPRIPVIANCNATLYREDNIVANLTDQLCSSVKWTDSIRFLMAKGQVAFDEIGPGNVLTKLVKVIVSQTQPLIHADPPPVQPASPPVAEMSQLTSAPTTTTNGHGSPAQALGSVEFMREYGIRYAYLAGAMYNGIASKELVVRMARAGFLGFLGTGGMKLEQVEESIAFIQREVNGSGSYGMNLIHTPHAPSKEMTMVDLFLARGIKVVEASAFIQMTPALVKYRLKGLQEGASGQVDTQFKIIAKVSRPEVARVFMSPPPEAIVKRLLKEGHVTQAQADIARRVPMADDICAEADSAGHTDGAIPTVLLPSMLRLRDSVCQEHNFARKVRVGAAGGIGTPEAAAAAFILGADFVLTGSINQCTVEAATSDQVKDSNPSANGVRLTRVRPPRLAARSDVRAKREAGQWASEALDGG